MSALKLVGGVLGVLLTVSLLWTGYRLATGDVSLMRLPSSYANGLTLPEAAEQAGGRPLLVEFYRDECDRCRQLTPWLHHYLQQGFDRCVVSVMVNVDDPQQSFLTELFAVDTLPSIHLFSPQQMKREAVTVQRVYSPEEMKAALAGAYKNLQGQACSLGE